MLPSQLSTWTQEQTHEILVVKGHVTSRHPILLKASKASKGFLRNRRLAS